MLSMSEQGHPHTAHHVFVDMYVYNVRSVLAVVSKSAQKAKHTWTHLTNMDTSVHVHNHTNMGTSVHVRNHIWLHQYMHASHQHGPMMRSYCQEWEIDQLLQFCMRNFVFVIWIAVFQSTVQPEDTPPRRTNFTFKWKASKAAPPIWFIFPPSRRGIFCSNSLH